jgi:hypothetical protein
MFPPREIETSEPFPIQDTFATDLVRVERVGPCRRLVFAVLDCGDPGAPQRVLIVKLIVPAEALPAIAAQLLDHAPADAAAIAFAAARGAATAH